VQVLAVASADEALPESVRGALKAAAAQPDGVITTALLIAKLRFERLVQGSRSVAEWFERDPEGLTDAFRHYHREVRPRALFPEEEAASFAHWLEDACRE
jgi:hypothetical protein